MNRYVEFVAKYKKWLLVLLAITLILAANGARQTQIGSEFDVFVTKDSVYADRMDEMAEAFDTKDQLMVMISMEGDLDKETLISLIEVNNYLGEILPDAGIVGPIMDSTLSVDTLTDQHVMMYEKQLEAFGELAPVVTKDGVSYYTFNLFLEETLTVDTLESLEHYLDTNNYEYAISGDTYMTLKVYDYITFIMSRVPGLALIILLLVFYSRIRTIKGTLLSLLPAVVGAIWTMGLVGYMGEEVSIITVLAPIFTIVIGSADGLHFIAHMQEELATGKPRKEALKHTLYMVGKPMIVTTVTSIAGFLALMVMDTDAIRSLAIFASVGVLNAGLATWFVLPIIITGPKSLSGRSTAQKVSSKGLKRFWGIGTVGVVVLVLAIFVLGVGNIPREFNMLSIYKESTEVYQNIEAVTEVNGGALPVNIYGTLPEGLSEMEALDALYEFGQGLGELDEVGKVISGADYIKQLGPQMLLNSEMSGMTSQFLNMSSKSFNMIVLPVDHNNETLEAIRDYVEEQSGPGQAFEAYDLKETGAGFMMMELNEGMMRNQISSSVLAIIIVFFLLWISLRHVKSALVSLVPIILTMLTLFGFMGIFDVSLNLMTSTIFSISIGVGIDYAIHFTSIWRVRVTEGMDSLEAAENAYRYTASPILANAFGLSLGFSALFLSPLALHGTIATLMWVAMVSSVVFSLVILPTILRKIES